MDLAGAVLHDRLTPTFYLSQSTFFLCLSPSLLTLITLLWLNYPVEMDAIVAVYSRPAFEDEGYSSDEHQELIQAKPSLSLNFTLPPMRNVSYPPSSIESVTAAEDDPQPSAFLRALTDDHANPNCPIKLAHGTTTLAFRFQGGIIVATDSRATAGDWIASQTVKKVIEINNCLLGTMAGGAAVGL